MVCDFVGVALEEFGHYRVSTVGTADQALPLLDRDRPDLVLLDGIMPGMPALEFALHSMQRGIPLIVMTGHPAMIVTLDALGWPHIRKPFSLDQLLVECAAAIVEYKKTSPWSGPRSIASSTIATSLRGSSSGRAGRSRLHERS
jgi:DNA-binding NtrC family response regulator